LLTSHVARALVGKRGNNVEERHGFSNDRRREARCSDDAGGVSPLMTKTISCPLCGGEIHAIAGRCKHCKADLVELRERAARMARAQALGATVPPPPRPRAPTAPPSGTRAVTQPGRATGQFPTMPMTPVMIAMGPAGFESADRAADAGAAPTLKDPPREPATEFAAPELAPPEYRVPDYQPPAPEYGVADFQAEHRASEYRAPEYARPPLTPPRNGAASGAYRLGFAAARPRRVSTWSRRWPFVVSAVALLAIGISIGVLAERWRRQTEARGEGRPRQSQVSRQPGMVPDHMPQPLMPAPPQERDVPDPPQGQGKPSARPVPPPEPDNPAVPPPDPDTSGPSGSSDPGSNPDSTPDPDASNPGSRFSQPRSPEHGDNRGEARDFRTFATALTDSLCHKLTQCGLLDSATQSMCKVFAQQIDSDDAAEKVARGECSFNRSAADACLQAVADLSCDMGSSDRMWDWLRAPNRVGECAEAFVCHAR
jgi:hypothetical protein